MYYLTFDNNGYLLGYTSSLIKGEDPSNFIVTDTIDNVDLENINRFRSYYWDGTRLVLDKKREAQLNATDESIISEEEIEREVLSVITRSLINSLDVDNATALRWKKMYPIWDPRNVRYTARTDQNPAMKVQWEDELYFCLQTHNSQTGYSPDLMSSLWEKISESTGGD